MKNEKGQALIFVVATMTVALAIGVGVSLRNLSSISRTTRSDTAARAQAAAEGGAENILAKSESELADMVGHVAKEIKFTPATGSKDKIVAVASVTVTEYTIPSGSSYFPLEVSRDQVSEVKLDGGAVEICWSSLDSNAGSDIYYTAYNDAGDITREGVEANNRSGFPSDYDSDGTFVGASGGNSDFDNCHDANLPSDALGIRIRSINRDSSLGVYPSSGSLPSQGYLITSVGRLDNAPEGEDAEVVVKVARSHPYMPGILDFGLYSGDSGAALE